MNLEIEIFQYLIKNTEPRIFRKNNHRDSDKNKLRTFEPRGGENFKNIELQRKKSGSYKKKMYTFFSKLYYRVRRKKNQLKNSTQLSGRRARIGVTF